MFIIPRKREPTWCHLGLCRASPEDLLRLDEFVASRLDCPPHIFVQGGSHTVIVAELFGPATWLTLIPLFDRWCMDLAARRIARRYQAAVVLRDEANAEATFLAGGIITTGHLIRMLAPKLGPPFKMRLRPALEGPPTTITWEALDQQEEVVSGNVVLHAGLDENHVVVWTEVFVDHGGRGIRVATLQPRQLLDNRLRRMADRARRVIPPKAP